MCRTELASLPTGFNYSCKDSEQRCKNKEKKTAILPLPYDFLFQEGVTWGSSLWVLKIQEASSGLQESICKGLWGGSALGTDHYLSPPKVKVLLLSCV